MKLSTYINNNLSYKILFKLNYIELSERGLGKTGLLPNVCVISRLKSSNMGICCGSNLFLALTFNKIPGFSKPSESKCFDRGLCETP
jgi:hypothetical protein